MSKIPDQLFYWAYGSNLNHVQMARRCPAARPWGPFTVADCALVFRGVADVTTRKGSLTPGGLWTITPACERALDRYEGVDGGLYMKRHFTLKFPKFMGIERRCLFYQMRTDRGVMPPSDQYMRTIAQGYRDFGLPLDVLDGYLQEAWNDKQPTNMLIDRFVRNGSPRAARSVT